MLACPKSEACRLEPAAWSLKLYSGHGALL